jgi:F5/8 type C domain
MTLIADSQQWSIPVVGIIHVGSNLGEDLKAYDQRGIRHVFAVDASGSTAPQPEREWVSPPRRWHLIAGVPSPSLVVERFEVDTVMDGVRPVRLWAEEGQGRTDSSPGGGAAKAPAVARLDQLLGEHGFAAGQFNLLRIDLLGLEAEILRGAVHLLPALDGVHVSCSTHALRPNGPTFLQMLNFLASYGFVIRKVRHDRFGIGSAFFAKPVTELDRLAAKSLARDKPCSQSSTADRGHRPAAAVTGKVPLRFSIHSGPDDPAPWWQVDLGDVHRVSRVLYLDRQGLEARAKSLKLLVSRDGSNYKVVFDRSGIDPEPLVDIFMAEEARYLRFALEDPGPLHFRQVIVLGEP